MKITTIDIEKINPAHYNPRQDLQPGDPEYDRLVKVMDEFNLVEPLVWNKLTGNLVGGHQRLKILKARGDKKVKVSVVELSESKEKALNIALNKTGGDWDMPKLKELLIEIDTGEFDMDLTGFGQDDLEDLMTQFYEPANIDDLLSELDISEAVDKPIWITVRTKPEHQKTVEKACEVMEGAGIRVERSYG